MTDSAFSSQPAPDPPAALEPERNGPRVALFGLGTVGTAVAARLLDPAWAAGVVARAHAAPRLVGIAE